MKLPNYDKSFMYGASQGSNSGPNQGIQTNSGDSQDLPNQY